MFRLRKRMVEGEWWRFANLRKPTEFIGGLIDCLDDYRQDPSGWAADMVMDHIDEDENGKPTREDVEGILGSIKDFLEASFVEEELEIPSDVEIVSCVMSVVI